MYLRHSVCILLPNDLSFLQWQPNRYNERNGAGVMDQVTLVITWIIWGWHVIATMLVAD